MRPGPFRAGLIRAVLVGAVLLAVALAGPAAGPAGAHTDRLQGSPGPGQPVGGVVDFVDLVFVGSVTEVEVEVRGPDGEVVPGEMVVADGQIIRHRMDPIEATGRYVVSYQMISEDGDFTEDSYFFDYRDGAFEPIRLGPADLPEEPIISVRDGVGVAAVLVLGAACLMLLVRLRRSRAELAARREGQSA